MSMESDAKEAAVLKMLTFFGSASSRLGDEQIKAYVEAVEDISLDAVLRSCKQFREGRVERNNTYIPTPVELAINARQWDMAIADVTTSQELRKLERITVYKLGEKPPPPSVPLGPTKIEIEGRMTDVSALSFEAKEYAIKHGRLPDSPAEIEAPNRVVPRLKRF